MSATDPVMNALTDADQSLMKAYKTLQKNSDAYLAVSESIGKVRAAIEARKAEQATKPSLPKSTTVSSPPPKHPFAR